MKFPTAGHNIGNGKVEGGVAAPATLNAGPFAFTVGPELDLLADADGHGYHAGLVNLLNVGMNLTSRLNLSAEVWNNLNFDPAGTVRQWSVDAGVAYLLNERVQLDGGANFGLNRSTPDVELYSGISLLF